MFSFIVLLSIYVLSCRYVTYFPTFMARYSIFVLKVPLNPKQTNKQFGGNSDHVTIGLGLQHCALSRASMPLTVCRIIIFKTLV